MPFSVTQTRKGRKAPRISFSLRKKGPKSLGKNNKLCNPSAQGRLIVRGEVLKGKNSPHLREEQQTVLGLRQYINIIHGSNLGGGVKIVLSQSISKIQGRIKSRE